MLVQAGHMGWQMHPMHGCPCVIAMSEMHLVLHLLVLHEHHLLFYASHNCDRSSQSRPMA